MCNDIKLHISTKTFITGSDFSMDAFDRNTKPMDYIFNDIYFPKPKFCNKNQSYLVGSDRKGASSCI